MDREQLLRFLRSHNLAVQSSVSKQNEPQAAVVGFAVTENFEFVFDTVDSTRKVGNLRGNPTIALTIGGLAEGDERTVQCNGIADEPSGQELESLKSVYFSVFPDGRDRQSKCLRAHARWVADEDTAAKAHRDPVAPAKRSKQALQKIAERRLDDGTPVHSFQTLLQQLSTIVRNTCIAREARAGSATFDMATTPDTTQRRALELVQAIAV